MKSDVKDLWVGEGLLSGKYIQARGEFAGVYLQDDGTVVRGTCCLAVLTDIAIQHGCEGVQWRSEGSADLLVARDRKWYDNDFDWMAGADEVIDGVPYDVHEDGDLPWPVREWAGIEDGNPTLNGVEAIERNDDRCDDFETIARAITDDPDL